jgi:hypothetical protein
MNYRVRISSGKLVTTPSTSLRGHSTGMVLWIDDRYGVEVREIKTSKDAILALYDELQGSDVLQDGDTFTMYDEKTPFAKVSGVHVIPYKSSVDEFRRNGGESNYFSGRG